MCDESIFHLSRLREFAYPLPVRQLDLFSPQPLALRSLQVAIESLDVGRSAMELAEYRKMWADEGLTFEPDVLAFFADRLPEEDPDKALLTWEEFSATPVFARLEPGLLGRMRANFFSCVLENLPGDYGLQTPAGASVGYLWSLAGRHDLSCRLLEQEIARYGDEPMPRVRLGNSHFEAGRVPAARDHYREALLAGLPADCWHEMQDPEVRRYLSSVEDGRWAAVEACFEGLFRVDRFSCTDSLTAWMRSKWQSDPSKRTVAEQPHDGTRFYVCLVLCANQSVCPEEILRDARLLMKKLNPRLHALYMARREGRDA